MNLNVNDFLLKQHRFIVETFFMVTLLLIWLYYIFPFLEMQVEDLKIAIAIAGFVWFSLLCFLLIFPYWITSWIFTIIETSYLLVLKTNRRLRNWKN